MPKISMTIEHHLPRDEALRVVQGLLAEVSAEHGDKISDLREEWHGAQNDFSFTALGFAVTGELTVLDGSIELHGSIPWLLLPFKSVIEQTIREHAEQRLA